MPPAATQRFVSDFAIFTEQVARAELNVMKALAFD